MDHFITIYCKKAHCLTTGLPIDHKCRVLPPAMLKAEEEGDVEKVVSFFDDPRTPLILSNGIPAEDCNDHSENR